ncbi:hypothetical protein Sango_2718600 [Sesamum angolense]|uniref:Uncharacterized protein n=1 Tax=Sesamum angolense TaxID=2727404 RepID=A0AAE1W3A4_9LAMI|nr:hypothetical protein Sango_2718600 [Sesamum angolense]
MADFFWNVGTDSKTHSLAWDKLSSRKAEGGLDFRRLKENNASRSSPSYTWRSLLASRELLVADIYWKLGEGNSVALLGHPWLPRPSYLQLICRLVSLANNKRVVASINSDFEWNRGLVELEFSPFDAECILRIKLKGNGARDELVWHYESHGRFLVGSAYRVAMNQGRVVGVRGRDVLGLHLEI